VAHTPQNPAHYTNARSRQPPRPQAQTTRLTLQTFFARKNSGKIEKK